MKRALFLTLLLASCLPQGSGGERPAPFADSFTREQLGDRYRKTGGSWRVLEGGLHTMGDHNQPLWLQVPLSRNMRVEFTGSVPTFWSSLE